MATSAGPIRKRVATADGLLLIASFIWGTAFVAQRKAAAFITPFMFNGLRFAIGTLIILPFVRKRRHLRNTSAPPLERYGGYLVGSVLFAGASLQQTGIMYTSAGHAGFITGIYVVLVPLLGRFFGHTLRPGAASGAVLTLIGLFFLSGSQDFHISFGDFIVFLGTFAWAAHVLIVAWLAPRTDPFLLAADQFIACAALSLCASFFWEELGNQRIMEAALPLAYISIFSVGIAYTTQVVAQSTAPPAHAAIILSSEAIFAAIAGFFVLGERFGRSELFGCCLMLSGMLISQLMNLPRKKE